MNCKNCGELLRENAMFCPKCGQKVEEQEKQVKSKRNKKSFWVVIAATIIVIAVIVGGIVLHVNMKAKDKNRDSIKDIEIEELTPMYNIAEIETVDIYAQNHTPGTKQEGLKWDSTFFYWLEDIKQDSTEDGYLAKCYITKTMLKDVQTGSEIQYEIYHDPETGEIYKIVSIEKAGETLKLTDYYYQNGKVNFIFTRTDSIYTPTYATIDKVGERFYFDGDVLVKWRKIEEPKVIHECTLTRSDVSYVQTSYFEEADEVRAEYDTVEMKMLNAAYNTYDAVQKSAIGAVNGTVADTLGEPIENLVVDIFRKADEVLLYRGTTDAEGRFNIFTYLDDTECYIVIRENEEYKESVVYGIVLASSGVDNSYNNLVLHKVNGDFYPVHVSVYFAEEVRTNEDGSVEKNLLSGATVSIREGAGAYEGEVLAVEKADAEGNVHINLQPGTYTAQIEIEGYQTSYLTIEVPEREIEVESYVLRKIPENQTGIVLTWENEETDLDLTLFTPYQSTEGDMAHIGGNTKSDDYGNQLIADNHASCEVVYVNTAEQGSYKVYVNNYTDSQAGNYESDALSKLNVHIYIYDSNGLVAEYTFPAGQNGVVWEAVELNGEKVTPIHRVYDRVDGKKWWNESKQENITNSNKTICEEFLNGERGAFIDSGVAGLIDFDGAEISLADMLSAVQMKYFEGENQIDSLQYAYLDCGNDGIPELAIRFGGLDIYEPDDDSNITYIFTCKNGELWLKTYIESSTKSSWELYYYGLIEGWTSMGAGAEKISVEILDKDIQCHPVYYAMNSSPDFSYNLDENFLQIADEVYGKNYKFTSSVIISEYWIREWKCILSPYYSYDYNNMEFLTIDATYIKKLEEYGVEFSTEQEIVDRIKEREQELGLDDVIMLKKEPDWITLNEYKYVINKTLNTNVEEQVKQIRTLYYNIQDGIDEMPMLGAMYDELPNSVSQDWEEGDILGYYANGDRGYECYPSKIVMKKGGHQWNYTREYYFNNGKLFFAFIYGNGEEHRLYFSNGQLIRCIDENGITYDAGEISEEGQNLANKILPEATEAYNAMFCSWD